MRLFQDRDYPSFIRGNQAEFGHGEGLGFLVEETQANAFPIESGQGRDADIEITLPLSESDAAALRTSFFRDVYPAHNLDAGNDGVLKASQVVGHANRH